MTEFVIVTGEPARTGVGVIVGFDTTSAPCARVDEAMQSRKAKKVKNRFCFFIIIRLIFRALILIGRFVEGFSVRRG